MDEKEILRAVQAGEISVEEAKLELSKRICSAHSTSQHPKNGVREENLINETEVEERKNVMDFSTNAEAIAIIGIAGRYPDADDLSQYWNNLVDGKNSINEIPISRWDVSKYYDPRPFQKGKTYSKWLGLLNDVECFDPSFFNISKSEAKVMDPQHRIFLQEAYKAFEDAGYSPRSLSNMKCGVYLGIIQNEYEHLGLKIQQTSHHLSADAMFGNPRTFGAARIAYFLNLKGPAIAIDTACSASLVATHLACRALQNREIDMALAGGVVLFLTPETYIYLSANGVLSPEGQCKAFDNSADGIVLGEGVGVLVLKRLADAQKANDHIYGVIIGSGINYDGKTNGITAPSGKSQAELEREVYDNYNIHPESISYAEMHGTGTKLGDPIELEALATVFRERTEKKNFCAIGSVKSNIGHTTAVAGIASVHKVLLCMKEKMLAPTLNVKKYNERFNFQDSPFYINTVLRPWTVSKFPRRASVSSFGISGTNAHMVIEEYLYVYRHSFDGTPVAIDLNSPILFVLSAKTEERLLAYAEIMKKHVERCEEINLKDMVYTLQVGRDAMKYRMVLFISSREDLINKLEKVMKKDFTEGILMGKVERGQEEVNFFGGDKERMSLYKAWLQKKELKKLADLWIKGLNVEWELLYDNDHDRPRVVGLPTYPFVKEKYWLQEPDVSGENN